MTSNPAMRDDRPHEDRDIAGQQQARVRTHLLVLGFRYDFLNALGDNAEAMQQDRAEKLDAVRDAHEVRHELDKLYRNLNARLFKREFRVFIRRGGEMRERIMLRMQPAAIHLLAPRYKADHPVSGCRLQVQMSGFRRIEMSHSVT